MTKVICNAYGSLLGHAYSVEYALCSDIQLWKVMWARTAVEATAALPATVKEALKHCDEDVYSTVHTIPKLGFRKFFFSAAVKNLDEEEGWRGKTQWIGVNAPAQGIGIDADSVINRFAKGGNR